MMSWDYVFYWLSVGIVHVCDLNTTKARLFCLSSSLSTYSINLLLNLIGEQEELSYFHPSAVNQAVFSSLGRTVVAENTQNLTQTIGHSVKRNVSLYWRHGSATSDFLLKCN